MLNLLSALLAAERCVVMFWVPDVWRVLSRVDLQSTYCATMLDHCNTIGRTVHVANLDPAAENFRYNPSIGKLRTC